MNLKTTCLRFAAAAALTLAVGFAAGCGTTLQYSYEPRTSFPALKTYQWVESTQVYRQDPLLEANVRFLTDGDLQKKGLAVKTEKADALVSIGYEFDYGNSYKLSMLTLTVTRADNNEPVWRGVATGSIKTDAASGELKKAVEGILAHFPPK